MSSIIDFCCADGDIGFSKDECLLMGADGALDINYCIKTSKFMAGNSFFTCTVMIHLYFDDLFPEYGIQIRSKYGNECLIYKYTDRYVSENICL